MSDVNVYICQINNVFKTLSSFNDEITNYLSNLFGSYALMLLLFFEKVLY